MSTTTRLVDNGVTNNRENLVYISEIILEGSTVRVETDVGESGSRLEPSTVKKSDFIIVE